MTRAYAARRLLEHGPLTLREIIEISGWPPKIASNVMCSLRDCDVVKVAIVERTPTYSLC